MVFRVCFALIFALLAAGCGTGKVLNGSFEQGLTHWSHFPTTGVTPIRVDVKNSSFGVTPTDVSLQAFVETSDIDGAPPASLESVLNLPPGSVQAFGSTPHGVVLFQDVTVQAGDILTFDVNMLTEELTLDGIISPFDDFAFFAADGAPHLIQDVNVMNFQLSAADLRTPTSQTTETGYQSFSYTYTSSGLQRLAFGVLNDPDISHQSALLIDNVRITAPAP